MILRTHSRLHRVERANGGVCACEFLEARRLLATFYHTVTSGHDVVYLTEGQLSGQVYVRLDSETGQLDHQFFNRTGLDVIQASPGATVTFVDRVRASQKPTVDPNATGDPFGIKVQGGVNGTLKIDATGYNDETLIEVPESTALTATVKVTDSGNNINYARFGDGVNKLFIKTNGFAAGAYYPDGGSWVKVPELNVAHKLTVDTGTGTYDLIYLGDPGMAAASVIDATVRTGAGHSAVVLATDGDDPATATIDFGSGGVGNTLDVFDGFSTATIAHALGGSGTIDVDEVRVHSGAVVIDDPANIDLLTVNNDGLFPSTAGTATITAGSTIAEAFVALNCTASIQAQSAIGPFQVDGTANFTASSTVERFTGSSGTVNVYGGAVTITGTSVTDAGSDLNVVGSASSALFLSTGSEFENVSITDGGLFTLDAGVGSYFRARTLSVGSQTSPTGKMDLTDGGLIIDHFGTSPHDYVKAVITRAYASGAWSGNGITSSTAAGMTNTGVGYAEATEIFSEFPATFLGRAVDNTSVLVRYTYYGDVNLGGYVNLADFNKLTSTFGQPNRLWVHGDSTYDGEVLIADFNRLANNMGLPSFGPEDEGGDGGGEGLRGGEPEYTYDELLAILMQMYPQYF